mmetsp:Transcript_31810/g.63037  ORF Transcript_31810/g.63037 Transcript_31810/m.63037 type:complete len:120 (+) Transcript_31810:881-1240(+)
MWRSPRIPNRKELGSSGSAWSQPAAEYNGEDAAAERRAAPPKTPGAAHPEDDRQDGAEGDGVRRRSEREAHVAGRRGKEREEPDGQNATVRGSVLRNFVMTAAAAGWKEQGRTLVVHTV